MSGKDKARKKLDRIIDQALKAARKAEKAAKRAEKALRKIEDTRADIRSDAKKIGKQKRELGKRIKSYVEELSDKAVRKNKIQKRIRKQNG